MDDPAGALKVVRGVVVGCRVLLLIPIGIIAIMIGVHLDGKPYVQRVSSECRLIYTPDLKIDPGVEVNVGGGQIVGVQQDLTTVVDTRDKGIVQYPESQPGPNEKVKHPWAVGIAYAKLPNWCREDFPSEKRWEDGKGGCWGSKIIVPAVCFMIVKTMGSVLEVVHMFDDEKYKWYHSLANWLVLTWLPNGLLATISSISDIEGHEGVYVWMSGFWASVQLACPCYLIGAALWAASHLKFDQDESKTVAIEGGACCCACICAFPTIIIYMLVIASLSIDLLFQLQINVSLNYPGVHLSGLLAPLQIMTFILALVDYVNLVLSILGAIATAAKGSS